MLRHLGREEDAAPLRAAEAASAPVVNRTRPSGEWLACESYDLNCAERRLWVEIPMGFTEMQARNTELALDWRMATRTIFTSYFTRGYRAVDFALDKPAQRGRYLLALRS